MELGLSKTDAEVYIFLATKGPQKARAIASQLDVYKQKLYRTLKTLQRKGMLTVTDEHPARFSAVSLEKILHALIQSKIEEALIIQRDKQELLSIWQSMITNSSKS